MIVISPGPCQSLRSICSDREIITPRLTVSPGLWLAFKGLGEDNLVLNIADIRHNPIEADNRDLEDISYDW